jgi:hypothetical protein
MVDLAAKSGARVAPVGCPPSLAEQPPFTPTPTPQSAPRLGIGCFVIRLSVFTPQIPEPCATVFPNYTSRSPSAAAMEAASARMAARDRYGAFGEAPTSPLQRFISTDGAVVVWGT